MAFAIYKSGQGYWTRMLSAIGAGILIIAGALWLNRELDVIADAGTRFTVQTATMVGILVGGLLLIYWLMNKPRIADFMIQTESEMKKVNWPNRRELIGSTWVVICGTVIMAVILFVIDVVFWELFTRIRILEGASPLQTFVDSLRF
jgi:preprotein translocase subunit SecE